MNQSTPGDITVSVTCLGFRLFFARSLSLSQQSVKASEHACQFILDKAGITGWRLGRSRVFLRYFHEEKLQLLLKEMEDKAVLIQKVYRGYHTRKWSVQEHSLLCGCNATKVP